MQYVIAFLEDIITFISPCLLPMLPTTYFIDADGYAITGAIDADTLQRGIDMILS